MKIQSFSHTLYTTGRPLDAIRAGARPGLDSRTPFAPAAPSALFQEECCILNKIYERKTALRSPRRLRSIAQASPSVEDVPSKVPTAGETARTVVDLVAHGTLCTVGEDGIPLGTYVSYVLDTQGQPILRLRADAVHTQNLKRDQKCSLFVQPGEHPARLLARVTLIGHVAEVSPDVAAGAAELHATLHAGGVGVDAPSPTDLYYRLVVDRCFYVGQLTGNSLAEIITGDEYRGAEPDPLRTCASSLTSQMNSNRSEDVIRIACRALGASFDDMYYAELLWLDRFGAYIKAVGQDGGSTTLRVPFFREVDDERDVRSMLTMLAQVAWEAERPYSPVAVGSVAA